MIKITFEFQDIREAVKFLQHGNLSRSNEKVGVLLEVEPLISEDAKDALESIVEVDDLPVRKRKSRVGKGASKSASVRKKGEDTKADGPKSSRRRKGKISSPVGEEGDKDDISSEITDADLAKAASIAAEAITPAKVMAVLEQFGVGDVSQLKGEDRREFLDLLDEEVEAEID